MTNYRPYEHLHGSSRTQPRPWESRRHLDVLIVVALRRNFLFKYQLQY